MLIPCAEPPVTWCIWNHALWDTVQTLETSTLITRRAMSTEAKIVLEYTQSSLCLSPRATSV